MVYLIKVYDQSTVSKIAWTFFHGGGDVNIINVAYDDLYVVLYVLL